SSGTTAGTPPDARLTPGLGLDRPTRSRPPRSGPRRLPRAWGERETTFPAGLAWGKGPAAAGGHAVPRPRRGRRRSPVPGGLPPAAFHRSAALRPLTPRCSPPAF